MTFRSRTRFSTLLLGTLALSASLGLAETARAGDKPFSSGIMFGGTAGTTATNCSILNLGTKPVTISSTVVLTGSQGQTAGSSFDGCSSAPLAPNTACQFGTSSGAILGGGTAIVTKGNLKALRGNCRLVDGGGVLKAVLPMQ